MDVTELEDSTPVVTQYEGCDSSYIRLAALVQGF